jgi:hypothetical protein
MADDDPRLPLQEAVIAMLCYDAEQGAAIAAQVKPEYFDAAYRDFARRVLQYRRKHGKPPGRVTVTDFAEQTFRGKEQALVKRRLLPQLLTDAREVNGEYILGRTQEFVERQLIKSALMEAGDRYDGPEEGMVDDVKRILNKSLRYQAQTLDSGLFLSDLRGVDWGHLDDDDIVLLGIPDLDELGIGLIPKEVLLYIGPKGSGKTWFCVHCGKQSLVQNRTVLHVTLEMSEMKIARRYYQSLFAIGRDTIPYQRAMLKFDGDLFKEFKPRMQQAKLAFSQTTKVRRILRQKIKRYGTRLGNLVIKEFPSGQLTMDMLSNYLDLLAEAHNFIPGTLIVDYPDLMATQSKTYRLDIGQNFVDLRGLVSKRGMRGVFPTQGNRKTIGGKRTRSNQVAEDIRKINTADTVLAYSRTEQEAAYNLGRLSVEHARDNREGMVMILSQSYPTGQFALNSARLRSAYWEQLKELSTDYDEDENADPKESD